MKCNVWEGTCMYIIVSLIWYTNQTLWNTYEIAKNNHNLSHLIMSTKKERKEGNNQPNARKIICASKQKKKNKHKRTNEKKKHHSHPHTSETSNHLTLFNETCHHNVDWFFFCVYAFHPCVHTRIIFPPKSSCIRNFMLKI